MANLNDLVVTSNPIPSIQEAAAELLVNVLTMDIDVGDPSIIHYVVLGTALHKNRTIFITDPTDFSVVYAIQNGEVNIAAVFATGGDAGDYCEEMNSGLLEFFQKESGRK